MWYFVIPCDALWYLVIPCDTLWYLVIHFHSHLPYEEGIRQVAFQLKSLDLPRASNVWEILLLRETWNSSFYPISFPEAAILLVSGRGSRPLARSNSGSPRFTDLPSLCACSESSLTNLIGSGLSLLCLHSHSKPECRWAWPGVRYFQRMTRGTLRDEVGESRPNALKRAWFFITALKLRLKKSSILLQEVSLYFFN